MRRNSVVDNLRGLAMLGVVGIHCGALVRESATPWPWLYVLCEVLTRFAVPTFFAVSGYGLFVSHPLEKDFDYLRFMRSRLRALVLPYTIWSILYLMVFQEIGLSPLAWNWQHMLYEFAYGKFCYQLYFMVILFWFYVSLPLWRKLIALLDGGTRLRLFSGLAVLAAAQLILFHINEVWWTYPGWMKNFPRLVTAIHERMSWLPLLYLFIFVCGALAARHETALRTILRRHLGFWAVLFAAGVAVMLAKLHQRLAAGENIWDAAPHIHQLTPEGLFYTICCLLFFSACFERMEKIRSPLLAPFNMLSRHSMTVYLAHPFFLAKIPSWTLLFFSASCKINLPALYVFVVIFSLCSAALVEKFSRRVPLLALLLTGKKITANRTA